MNAFALHPAPPALPVPKPRWLKLSRLTPVGLSVLIHGLLFIYFGANIFDDGGTPTKHGPISVRLQPAPEPVPALVPVPEASPTTAEPPETLQTKALAPPRPAQMQPVIPDPLSTIKSPVEIPPITTDEIPVAQTEPQIEMQSESHAETPLATTPATTAMAASTATVPTKESLATKERQQIKQQYLATLMAHIESHKYYPRAARQRRMEGLTTVRFTLLASGEVCEISISNGPKLLRIASKTALQKALPLPEPPDTLDYPMPIQFDMEYRLI